MLPDPKKMTFAKEARAKLCARIEILAAVVGATLGSRGKAIGLTSTQQASMITLDGNSIAQAIKLKDPYANMGVLIGKKVVAKIRDGLGDGAATTALFTEVLVADANLDEPSAS